MALPCSCEKRDTLLAIGFCTPDSGGRNKRDPDASNLFVRKANRCCPRSCLRAFAYAVPSLGMLFPFWRSGYLLLKLELRSFRRIPDALLQEHFAS